MKSERGQVQESNLLADKIEQKVLQLRPYLPALIGLILVGILGLIGYGVYSSQRESRAARAWTDFYFSDTQIQDLDAISKDYVDTSASLWARMTAGDRGMAQAMEKWNVDRSIADQRFQEASEDYRDVASRASDPFVKSRALYGWAQALEGLGKRSEAVETYRQITSLTGLPPEYLTEINNRIKWLEGKEGEAFYAWYNEQRTSAPAAGITPSPTDLPGLPNISFPPTSIAPPVIPPLVPGSASPTPGSSGAIEPVTTEPITGEPGGTGDKP
jgi:tetratricopeptide (TPR) repeat protein